MIGVAALAMLAGGWKSALILAAIFAALALLAYVVYSVAKGDCDRILIGWVLLFPLGYYYLSFPRTAPIVQFDRTIVLVLVACMLVAPKARAWPVPNDMKRVGKAWALLLAVTLLSFLMIPDASLTFSHVLTIGRMIVEVFLLPALLGWYVVRQFRLRPHAKWLHVAICVISIYSVALGIADVVLQRHVLTYDFSGEYWAYDPTDPTGFAFLRPSGPFISNGSFSLVGLISFFLLAFLWPVIRDDSGPVHRVLHVLGSSAAMLQALLTLTRAIVISIVVCAVIGLFWSTGFRRMLQLVALGIIALLVAGLAILAPGAYKDRTNTDNFYVRFSQNEQSWRIFADHPLVGVGLTNYTPLAESTPRYQTSFKGVEQVNFPHNNIGWMAAETGIAGTVPYLMSQLLLIVAFWRLRKRGERGVLVWRSFVFVFLSYWVEGMAATTGSSGDLNLWFAFALSLLYRYGVGETSDGTAPTLCPVAKAIS